MSDAAARQGRINRALGWAFAASALGGAVLAGAYFAHRAGLLSEGIAVALAMVGLTAALAACVPWWRRLDEMAREAHGVAWFWGGSFGMGVALIGLMIGRGIDSPQLSGAVSLAVAEVLGYGVAWIGWWAWRRWR